MLRFGSEPQGIQDIHLWVDGRHHQLFYTSLHVDFDRTYWQHSSTGFAD